MVLASFSRCSILGAAICAIVCNWPSSPAAADQGCPADSLCIELTGAELSYEMSYDYTDTSVCNITARVTNNTAYHLRYMSATVDNIAIKPLEDIGADLTYEGIPFSIKAGTCAAAVRNFVQPSFTIQRCSMEGIAEERACKKMVRIIPPDLSTRQTDANAATAAAVARRAACHEVDIHNAYFTSRLGHCLATCPSSSRSLTDNCGAACYAANDDISLEAARNIVAWCIR
jgi:hypothetical protein